MCKFHNAAVLLITAGFVTGCVQQPPIADATGTQLGDQQSLLLVDSEQRIGPEGGLVTFTPSNSDVIQKAVLEIPAGALTEPVNFSMKLVTRTLIPSNGPWPVAAIEIEPSGTRFLVPAKLTYHYDWQAIDDKGGIDEAFLEIALFDERVSALRQLPHAGLDMTRHRVAAHLEHLSTYALIVPTIFPKPSGVSESTKPGIVPVLFVHGIQIKTQCWENYVDGENLSKGSIHTPICTFGAISPAVISGVTVDGQKVCKEFSSSDLPSTLKNLPMYQINYFTLWDINSAACALKSAISRVLDAHPGYKSEGVRIVAHSMGGLVTRAYIQDKGKFTDSMYYDNKQYPGKPNIPWLSGCAYNNNIYQVMTLGTPHGGGNLLTQQGDLGGGPNCRKSNSNEGKGESPSLVQMDPGSTFLNNLNDEFPNELNASSPHPQYIAYFGDKDGSVSTGTCYRSDWKQILAACDAGLGEYCCSFDVCGEQYGTCVNHGSMISNLKLGQGALAGFKAKGKVIDGPNTNSGKAGLFNDVGHCPVDDDTGFFAKKACGVAAHGIASIDDTKHPLYKIVCEFIGGCSNAGGNTGNTNTGECEISSKSANLIHEDNACTERGGKYWWDIEYSTGKGFYTYTTDDAEADSYMKWYLSFESAGLYRFEAYIPSGENWSRKAVYKFWLKEKAEFKTVDQDKYAGKWALIGELYVAEGGDQALRLNDNTGEKYVKGKSPKLAVDGIRITKVKDVTSCASPPCGSIDEDNIAEESSSGCGVSTTPANTLGILIMMLLLIGFLFCGRQYE